MLAHEMHTIGFLHPLANLLILLVRMRVNKKFLETIHLVFAFWQENQSLRSL